MNQCENPELDLCDPNCGTIDCHNYGCIIKSIRDSTPVVKSNEVEITDHVRQRLDRLNTSVSNTIGVGA